MTLERIGHVGAAAAAGLLAAALPNSAQALCSVFEDPVRAPAISSMLDDARCRPDSPSPFSQDLRLTIEARSRDQTSDRPTRVLNTVQELFDAFAACWIPPPSDQARPGTEITVRFSLNRAGEIMGEPRFTYATRALPKEMKAAYQRAAAAALSRCTPLPLSAGLGGAIAGRPISMRFIDDREMGRTENTR